MRIMALLLMAGFALSGCKALQNLSDVDLAAKVQRVTKSAAQNGLVFLLAEKTDEEVAEIKEKVLEANTLIRGTVIPVFVNPDSGEVLRSTLDTALSYLSDEIDPRLISIIQLSVDMTAEEIDLPDNPAANLENRYIMALVAFFTGLADGLDAGLAQHEAGETPSTESAPHFRKVINDSTRFNRITWPIHFSGRQGQKSSCGCVDCDCDPCFCNATTGRTGAHGPDGPQDGIKGDKTNCHCDPCLCDPCHCNLGIKGPQLIAGCHCNPCLCDPCYCSVAGPEKP
jgi:hypothetical protein